MSSSNSVFVDINVGCDLYGCPCDPTRPFASIQAAIASIQASSTYTNPYVVFLKPGVYTGTVTLYDGITIEGYGLPTSISGSVVLDPGIVKCGLTALSFNTFNVVSTTFTSTTPLINIKLCIVNGVQTITGSNALQVNYQACIFNITFTSSFKYFDFSGPSGASSFTGPSIIVQNCLMNIVNVGANNAVVFCIDINGNVRFSLTSNAWLLQFKTNPTTIDLFQLLDGTSGIGGAMINGDKITCQSSALSTSGTLNILHSVNTNTYPVYFSTCSFNLVFGNLSAANYITTDNSTGVVQFLDCTYTAPFIGPPNPSIPPSMVYSITDGLGSLWQSGGLSTGGLIKTSTNYTVVDGVGKILASPALLSTITITLPAATGIENGRELAIVNLGPGIVSISGGSGTTTNSIANTQIFCVSDGISWYCYQ